MIREDCCTSNGVVTNLSCVPPPQQSQQPFHHIPPWFSLRNILSSPIFPTSLCYLPLPLAPLCISLPYFWPLPVSPRFSHVIASAFSCVLSLASFWEGSNSWCGCWGWYVRWVCVNWRSSSRKRVLSNFQQRPSESVWQCIGLEFLYSWAVWSNFGARHKRLKFSEYGGQLRKCFEKGTVGGHSVWRWVERKQRQGRNG